MSEWERPDNAATTNHSVVPRVAWRGDTVVITWQSANAPTVLADPVPPYPVLAARIFTVPTPSLSVTKSGENVILAWGDSGGTLESADAVTGPWALHVGVQSPYPVPISAAAKKFFRVHVW